MSFISESEECKIEMEFIVFHSNSGAGHSLVGHENRLEGRISQI